MKKLYTLAILLLVSIGAFAQEGRNIYNKWSDSEGVSAVYISPSMFKMIGRLPDLKVELNEGQMMDLAPIITALEGFYMLDIPNSEASKSIAADVKSIISKSKRYELMMEAKGDGDNLQIFTVGDDKVIKSLVFLCNSSDDVQFISIDGTINRSELEAIIGTAAQKTVSPTPTNK